MKILIIKNNENDFEQFYSKKMIENGVEVLSWKEIYKESFQLKEGIRRLLSVGLNLYNLNKIYNFSKYNKIIVFDKWEIFLALHLYCKGKKIFLYMWNKLGKRQGLLLSKINLLTNNIYSFDTSDVKTFGIKYNSQFYFFDNYLDNQQKNKKMLFFVGQDKGRVNQLLKIRKYCNNNNINYKFMILKNKNVNYPLSINDLFIDKYVPYLNLLSYIKESAAIIDLVQEGQSGLTVRVMEALKFNKKIITNNQSIKKFKFYNSNNIYLLEEKGINDLSTFLDNKENVYSKNEKLYFDFKQWLARFVMKD